MKWVHIFFVVLALALLALVVVAATTPEQATQQAEGRYQIIMCQEAPALFCFLLDTETGRVWSAIRADTEGKEPNAWLLMERIGD